MKTKHLRLMQRVYIILFFCFMYLPIAYMIVFSFNQSKGYSLFTGFTFKWYRSLFTNASILHALWVSVEVAVLSAIIATVLGTAASLGIASMSRKSRLLVTNITYIPVVNPEIITGISLMLLFVAYQRFATQSAWLPDNIISGRNCIRAIHHNIHIPPVSHQKSFISPFFPQNPVAQVAVSTCKYPVNFIKRSHNAAYICFFYQHFKWFQIQFPGCPFRNNRIYCVILFLCVSPAVGFLLINCEMLWTHQYLMIFLYAFCNCAGTHSCKKRIF